ncbi:MAG: CHAT domain-containing protein [candidate division KSB1 bacterium]|nr:CHAT domain-containing protein [candidate division KSB1 bacterium]
MNSVVLSACEMGLGKIARAEGLIGLARGFLYASAASLLMSLWRMNDVSTANLWKTIFAES